MTERPPLHDYDRSRAVVMGTWDYVNLAPVPAARHSLDRMKGLLTGPVCGWPEASVTTVANAARPGDLPDELMSWFQQARDVALFYFVGHGQIDDEDELCLGLCGSVVAPERRATTSLPFNAVRRALLRSPARVKILILDCCFAGQATGRSNALAASSGELLESAGGTGAFTMAASGAWSTAWFETAAESGRPQTYFTKYFVDLVERGVPGLPPTLRLAPLFAQVRENLARDRHPVPQSRNVDAAHDFPFAHNVAPVTPPATQRVAVQPAPVPADEIDIHRPVRLVPLVKPSARTVVSLLLGQIAVTLGWLALAIMETTAGWPLWWPPVALGASVLVGIGMTVWTATTDTIDDLDTLGMLSGWGGTILMGFGVYAIVWAPDAADHRWMTVGWFVLMLVAFGLMGARQVALEKRETEVSRYRQHTRLAPKVMSQRWTESGPGGAELADELDQLADLPAARFLRLDPPAGVLHTAVICRDRIVLIGTLDWAAATYTRRGGTTYDIRQNGRPFSRAGQELSAVQDAVAKWRGPGHEVVAVLVARRGSVDIAWDEHLRLTTPADVVRLVTEFLAPGAYEIDMPTVLWALEHGQPSARPSLRSW